MWFNRNRRKISIFVGKNRIKTRPDIQTLDRGKADLKEDEIIQLRMNFEEEIE